MIRVGRRAGLSMAAAALPRLCWRCVRRSARSAVMLRVPPRKGRLRRKRRPGRTSRLSRNAEKKADPKPEPTAAELFEYIRGSLIEFSPDDRINDNLDASLDPTATVLTITQPDGHCDQFLSALDANTVMWDIYDASDSMTSRQPLLRLTVVSLPGKNARTCYDLENQVDAAIPANRARFLFLLAKIPDRSGASEDEQGDEEADCAKRGIRGEGYFQESLVGGRNSKLPLCPQYDRDSETSQRTIISLDSTIVRSP